MLAVGLQILEMRKLYILKMKKFWVYAYCFCLTLGSLGFCDPCLG